MILGLAGFAGSGKDFVFADLEGGRGPVPLSVIRVASSDLLKADIEAALGGYIGPLWEKPYTPEVRALLQWWGTELRRGQDETYWVRKMRESVAFWEGQCDLVVVTDVRFANEADAIRDLGGIVLEVYATGELRAERLGGVIPPAHASEVIDFRTDGVIVNNVIPVYPPALYDYLELHSAL